MSSDTHSALRAEPASQHEADGKVTCPDCNGDGKETCHNPDHGFIGAMSFHDIGRLGCPVCGTHPQRKVRGGGTCSTCDGSGEVCQETASAYLAEPA